MVQVRGAARNGYPFLMRPMRAGILFAVFVLAVQGQDLFLGLPRSDLPTKIAPSQAAVASVPTFTIEIGKDLFSNPVTGRVFLFLSTTNSSEPRASIRDGVQTQQFFGIDVTSLRAGDKVTVGEDVLGYPLSSTRDIPIPRHGAKYWIQAVLQPYHLYNRSDGLPVWLPRTEVNRFEGGDIFTSPGTFYSKAIPVEVPFSIAPLTFSVAIDRVEPYPPSPDGQMQIDTDYIKHVRIRSELLSTFWGEDFFLEACVLLPWGYSEHSNFSYPVFLYHGHYHDDWATPAYFSEKPPAAGLTGYDLVQAQYAYDLYRNWTAPEGPFKGARGMIVTVKHPNPYYDDSYAVNSANLGPYGDAIMNELLPEVERRFRGIGAGWARTTYGGSTGGWESLAVQVFYPDGFNGCWTFCPDPVSFDRYTTVNIYEDENAYYSSGPWLQVPRAAIRDDASNGIWHGSASKSYGTGLNLVGSTQEQVNQKELVKGTKARSTDQWDIWQLVFGPKGEDGYVKPIWDKRTGVIDKEVAKYWRDHFDIKYRLKRDWATIGPKLRGKMHLYVGMSDTYYLNNAVYSLEDFLLDPKTQPPSDATFDYGQHDGRGYEHCYSGNHGMPNSLGRLTINARVLPQMAEHLAATAPPDADMRWRHY